VLVGGDPGRAVVPVAALVTRWPELAIEPPDLDGGYPEPLRDRGD
jgi:hypothetical protein